MLAIQPSTHSQESSSLLFASYETLSRQQRQRYRGSNRPISPKPRPHWTERSPADRKSTGQQGIGEESLSSSISLRAIAMGVLIYVNATSAGDRAARRRPRDDARRGTPRIGPVPAPPGSDGGFRLNGLSPSEAASSSTGSKDPKRGRCLDRRTGGAANAAL